MFKQKNLNSIDVSGFLWGLFYSSGPDGSRTRDLFAFNKPDGIFSLVLL
jgi:hypothetical protein